MLAELITMLATRIPKAGPVAVALREVIRTIISEILKTVTRQFVINKIKKAITDPTLRIDFQREVAKILKDLIIDAYKERIEELEAQKESYKLAYEELQMEKKKKIEGFNEYIENLKDIYRKLTLCGGLA